MDKNKDALFSALTALGLAALIPLLLLFVFYVLWNWIAAGALGLPALSFLQSGGFLLLLGTLVGFIKAPLPARKLKRDAN